MGALPSMCDKGSVSSKKRRKTKQSGSTRSVDQVETPNTQVPQSSQAYEDYDTGYDYGSMGNTFVANSADAENIIIHQTVAANLNPYDGSSTERSGSSHEPLAEETDSLRMELKTYFDTSGSIETTLKELVVDYDMEKVACLFYRICDLANHNFIKVQKNGTYIVISRGDKM